MKIIAPVSSAVLATVMSARGQCPPGPAGTCQWMHCCGAVKQVLPLWPVSYSMAESTIIMPCNSTGLIRPNEAAAKDFQKWSFASIDWSNGKNGPTGWAQKRPMDAETPMVEQAALLKAANPKQKVGVYRNIVAAQPWFPSVAAKLRDPAYRGWFLRFNDTTSPTYAPRCDTPDPPQVPICSDLYHGTEQVPRYPPIYNGLNDGNCSAPGCDCGGLPCGRYLFNHTNSSLREWLVNEHILGDTAIGNPNISAIYLDDNWQNFSGYEAPHHFGGPTEISRINTSARPWYDGVIDDLGFSQEDVNAQVDGWRETMLAVQDAVIKAGGWSWAWFLTGRMAPKGAPNCTAYFRSKTTRSYAQSALQMSLARNSSTNQYVSLREELATFLLVRGDYAWLGAGWGGCDNYPDYIPEFELDYGVPLTESYEEVEPGIFERDWTKASISFNCTAYEGTITMRDSTTPAPPAADIIF